MDMTWKVTVLHGKTSLSVALVPPTSDTKWLDTLQHTIAEQTGVAVAHQKLLFRGKQLTMARGAELANGAKLMLLKNARFHQSAAVATKPKEEDQTLEEEEERPRTVAVSQRLGMDASDVDETHVLVQASRGKSLYEFLFVSTATIATVKTRIGGALGLSGGALRLLLKGKTPKDDQELSCFLGPNASSRVVKCMVLLQAKQHDLVEREEEFRVLQNELTSVDADLQRLAKVMHRNLLAREEVLFRLHGVHDHIVRLQSNLGILEEQLKATKLVQGSATLLALTSAQRECETLATRAEAMAVQFEKGGGQ